MEQVTINRRVELRTRIRAVGRFDRWTGASWRQFEATADLNGVPMHVGIYLARGDALAVVDKMHDAARAAA